MTNQEELVELLSGFETAMFITKTPEGEILSRPMAIAKMDANAEIWFVTDQHSGKMIDLSNDKRVGLTFQKKSRFIAISGNAQVSIDRNQIEGLWQESWRAWFPAGAEDPSLCLLHVLPTHAEYWDNFGSEKGKEMLKTGEAQFKGVRLGTNETPDLTSAMPR